MNLVLFILLIIIWIYVLWKISKYTYISLSFHIFLVSCFIIGISFFIGVFSWTFSKEIKNSDILFLLDVSKSMDALDYRNEKQAFSRLQAAKLWIQKIVETYPENRYWLSIFAGEWIDVVPFTYEKDVFLTFLEWMNSASLLQWWNNMIFALEESFARFEAENTVWWVIILSDFEFPKMTRADVDWFYKNTKIFIPENIKIMNIWFGSEIGNRILIGNDTFFGSSYLTDGFQEVITRYDRFSHEWMKQITQSQNFFVKSYKNIWEIPKKLPLFPQRDLVYTYTQDQSIGRWIGLMWYWFFLFYMILYYRERKKKNGI